MPKNDWKNPFSVTIKDLKTKGEFFRFFREVAPELHRNKQFIPVSEWFKFLQHERNQNVPVLFFVYNYYAGLPLPVGFWWNQEPVIIGNRRFISGSSKEHQKWLLFLKRLPFSPTLQCIHAHMERFDRVHCVMEMIEKQGKIL